MTLRACIYTLKHIHDPDFRNRLDELFNIINAVEPGENELDTIERLLTYIWKRHDIEVELIEKLTENMEPEAREAMVTKYKSGWHRAQAEGKLMAEQDTLINLLEVKFGPLSGEQKSSIQTCDDTELLKEVILSVLKDITMEEILRPISS